MACCSCCEKTGACCNDGVCSEETCADCESAGGVFQGVDTTCAGVGEDECPCDPPTDPSICEKCVDGTPTDYCPATDCCTDGTCKPCPPPYCPEEPCTGTDCCVDGQCVTCPEPTCPTVACTGDLCCVDGYCVPCPDYDCDPECDPGDCCVDGVCEPCESCDPGDCPSGQCCVDGFCTDCPDPCDPGDCGPGYCCVDGFCLPCPPRECPDPPCPSGECCIDGYCINPCPEGEYCCNGVCQEEPCGCSGACDDNDDCEEGCQCCDGECDTQYCHYSAEAVWGGEGAGDACPAGFSQSGLSESGKRICKTCETETGPCDDQAWWESVDPGGNWDLILNSLGVTSDCNEEAECTGTCDPDYAGSCCPGCVCDEVEPDYYECVAEEPPP